MNEELFTSLCFRNTFVAVKKRSDCFLRCCRVLCSETGLSGGRFMKTMHFLKISTMFVLLIAHCFAVPNFFGHTVHPRKVNNFSALNRMLSSLPFQPRMDLMPSAGQRVNHVVRSS